MSYNEELGYTRSSGSIGLFLGLKSGGTMNGMPVNLYQLFVKDWPNLHWVQFNSVDSIQVTVLLHLFKLVPFIKNILE